MHNDFGLGGFKLILSLAFMINTSMLIGLTQGDAAKSAIQNLRQVQQAASEIKKHEQEMRHAEWQLRHIDQIADARDLDSSIQ